MIIDRFDGDFAVVELEDTTTALISKKLIPNAQEGDVIQICVDKKATAQRKNKIKELMNDLWT